MAEYGLLTEVVVEPRTTELASDAAVSDTDLEVVDAGDFLAASDADPDGGGGTLLLGGVQLEYSDVIWGETEDDTDLIVLVVPLAVAADAGDPVQSVSGGLGEEDWYALVDMGGGGDFVAVPIRYDQRQDWPEGIYTDPVRVQVSEDLQHIEDAPGRTSAGRVLAFTDTFTAPGPGDATIPLTFTPTFIIHVQWCGVFQELTEWSWDGDKTVTFPDADSMVEADDVLTVTYLYDGAAAQIERSPLDPNDEFEQAVLAIGAPILWADLGDAGNVTTRDISGNNRDGEYVGTVIVGRPPLAPGLPGTSVEFDGSGSAEWATAESWQRPPVFSAMIWAKPSSAAFDMFMFGADDLGTADPTRCWNIADDTAARIYSGSNIYPADGAAAIGRLAADTVAMVFLTFDGTTLKFYKDDTLVQTTTAAAMNTSNTYPLSIAASANGRIGRFAHFLGELQHAVMWDVVATAGQVAAVFNAGMGS